MVDLLGALDFWWVVGKVLVDREAECERAVFVHALVGVDGKSEVKDIVGIWEVGSHGRAEREV